jgi:hypothetical protein
MLLKVNDFSAAVLAGDGQARFATGQYLGDFGEHFLRGIIGLAQMCQDDVFKALML